VARREDPASGVLLRHALPEESDEVAALWLASRRDSIPAIPAPVHTDDEVRGFVAEKVQTARAVWVAESAGRLVAMMVLEDGWIEQLHVAPGWTGRGVGARLVALAQEDQPVLELWTFAANHAARRFYERHGFVLVEETDGSGNEERTPDVRYEWRAGS